MRKPPKPRNGNFYGMKISNLEFADGAWLEGEEFCYPAGGMTRKALANCPDGQKRVCIAGIADTYFSIPARTRIKGKSTRGYLSISDEILKFTPYDKQKTEA